MGEYEADPANLEKAATLFGEGQVQNIAVSCEQNEAELVIVDGALSAIQQRNLEEKLKRKVIDRTGLSPSPARGFKLGGSEALNYLVAARRAE